MLGLECLDGYSGFHLPLFLLLSRLYIMRDACELCVKTSKISKLFIVYRG